MIIRLEESRAKPMVFLFLAPTCNLPPQIEQDRGLLQRWLHGAGKMSIFQGLMAIIALNDDNLEV